MTNRNAILIVLAVLACAGFGWAYNDRRLRDIQGDVSAMIVMAKANNEVVSALAERINSIEVMSAETLRATNGRLHDLENH